MSMTKAAHDVVANHFASMRIFSGQMNTMEYMKLIRLFWNLRIISYIERISALPLQRLSPERQKDFVRPCHGSMWLRDATERR